MPAALGQTTDPRALVPGDPDTIVRQARTLDERRRDVEATGQGLRRIDTGGWTGAASDRFHEQHNTDVPRWFHAADSFDVGARTLTEHAHVLSWAQARAGEAIALWQRGEAATAAAVAAHETAVADAAAATRANAARNDPTLVTAPGFVDPGAALREQARAVLAEARRQLAEAGDRAAEALLAEAETAPQDSLEQADANFYGGIGDTLAGAAAGAWRLLEDPAGAVASAASAALDPVGTAKDAVAWDDWAAGRGDVALGKVTGSVLLGGAGLVIGKALRAAGDDGDLPDTETVPAASGSPRDRIAAAVNVLTDDEGRPHGVEDSAEVRLVDESRIVQMRDELREKLGEPPTVVRTPKGTIETWMLDPENRSNVTFRDYSGSGGLTIDVNRVDAGGVKRYHVTGGR